MENIEKIREHASQLAAKEARSNYPRPFHDLLTFRNCHNCKVKPGEIHKDGCEMEHCSVCGGQRVICRTRGIHCDEHDKGFARWTGFQPGALEAHALGVNLADFLDYGFSQLFLVKPKKEEKAATA